MYICILGTRGRFELNLYMHIQDSCWHGEMFFNCSIEVLHSHAVGGQTCVKHVIAVVDWLQNHAGRDAFEPEIEVWQKSHLPAGMYSFLPVAQIRYLVAFSTNSLQCPNPEEVIVAIRL